MEDKKTRRQENKTNVLCAEGIADPAGRTNVSYSCIPVFSYSPKHKTMASKSFREVMAWQKAHAFVLAFYKTKPSRPTKESRMSKSNVLYSCIPVFSYSKKKDNN